MFTALLQGLQDLAFLGSRPARGVGRRDGHHRRLAFAGAGLYALAAGWVVSQLLPALVAWRRVTHAVSEALPRDRPRLVVA